MLGNATDAALALTGPKEFWISDGCTRSVYLINGVIYKVEFEEGANQKELENLARLATLEDIPDELAIPNSFMWHGQVLAMDYIVGDDAGACFSCEGSRLDCRHCAEGDAQMSPETLRWLNENGIYDVIQDSENILRVDNLVYLIDAAA